MNDLFKSGTKVVLKKNIRNHKQEQIKKTCIKCNGTKIWKNSFDDSDVRPCLNCNGKGEIIVGINVNDINGKPIWNRFPKGTIGTVKNFEIRGKFNTRFSPSKESIRIFIESELGSFYTNSKNLKILGDENAE